MPTMLTYGNGVQTRFEVPGSLNKNVFVGGVAVTPVSTDFQSVTLSPAPALGVPVQVNYDPTQVRTLPGPSVLANSAVAQSATGLTTEVVLATVVLPGGTLGPNGALRINAGFTATNNANAKFASVKFGGQALLSMNLANGAAGSIGLVCTNRNSLASQYIRNNGHSPVTGLNSQSTANTAIDQILQITMTLAVGTDIGTLESFTIEVLPGF